MSVTYGQEQLIGMVKDLLREIPGEYRNKRAFIGADDILFDETRSLPDSGIYRLFRSGGGIDRDAFWEVFSPEIRHTAYFAGIESLLGLLEKSVGLNKGILTDLSVDGATATAIRRSMFDTFTLVSAMRRNVEAALADLLISFGVLADSVMNLPNGRSEYSVSVDWSFALIEDTNETFGQYMSGHSVGAVRPEEIRMYLFDESREQAVLQLTKNSEQ
ncbi:hypothetical protein FACS1894105_14280 [Clostridia bacterium]|nr:hypothetical protein FACS1894105_14280 [Clostridia bacterium]